MIGLELLLAHLVGDYILQNDWMAANKVIPHPGPGIHSTYGPWGVFLQLTEVEKSQEQSRLEWERRNQAWRMGNFSCTVHCLLYTLSVFAFTWYWMPWWGLLLCFAIHWPVDRFRLARKWMENVSGQHAFANGVFAPWSIILVDNIFHLLILYGIWACAGGSRT